MPIIQKKILARASRWGRFAITATQMLESMTSNSRPTRAEASDVANAIFDGSDAVMLSAETASGKYPVEAVQMMARIVFAAQDPTTHAPTGEWRDFVTGFGWEVGDDAPLDRPADVTFLPDGRMIFADDLGNGIYWVAPQALRIPTGT